MDAQRLKIIAFKNYWFAIPVPAEDQADHIRKLLQGESILPGLYRSVRFLYVTPVSVLVPAPLFNKENPEVYFKLSSQLSPSDQVLCRRIPVIDSYIAFPVPEDIIRQVRLLKHDVQFFNQTSPLIDLALKETANAADYSCVQANVNHGFADLSVIGKSQLLLYNSFIIRNTNDLVFFILYMYEQFSLPQDECPLILSGFIELYDGTVELLHPYIKKIDFRKFPDKFNAGDAFSEIKEHQFAQLFNLALCE